VVCCRKPCADDPPEDQDPQDGDDQDHHHVPTTPDGIARRRSRQLYLRRLDFRERAVGTRQSGVPAQNL
jgi:hypothetical protein